MSAKNQPLVSVIIPVHNRAHFILETVESVFNQTYENIETLIIDDGSTDDLAEVLKPLIETNKIRYYHQEKQGVSAARNKGLGLARGEFVAFLDSDDLFSNNKIHEFVSYLHGHEESVFIHSNFEKFDSETRNSLGVRDTSFFKGDIYPEILLHWKSLIATSCVMFRKEIITEIGFFSESLTHGEDLEYWVRIAKRYPIAHLPKVLVGLRVHRGNVSTVDAETSTHFRDYLDHVFENDPELSDQFKNDAISKMHINTGLMLLSSPQRGAAKQARNEFATAIRYSSINAIAVLGYLVSLLPFGVRVRLYGIFRKPKSRDRD